MPSREWKLRIEDILWSIAKIERHTAGLDFEAFEADEKAIDAVVRNMEIIGEASRHIPKNIQKLHPHIPWDKMRDIRNVFIHEYFGVSISILWQTLKEDLPPLVPLLQEVLKIHKE